MFAYELEVVMDKPHGGDVEVRKVVGSQDIALFRVKRLLKLNAAAVEKKEEKEPLGPKPVERSRPVLKAGYKDGHQEKREQKREDQAKNKEAVS